MAITPRPFGTPRSNDVPSAGPTEPLRRCTFRRIEATEHPRGLPVYEVACTFPDRKRAVALGDIEAARPICASCTYQGIFRADSD